MARRNSSTVPAGRDGRRRAVPALVRGGLLAVAFATWTISLGAPLGAQDRKTVWDKVYTADQAVRGKAEYDQNCAGCHQTDLKGRSSGGEGPELVGGPFTRKWDFQTLNQLFTEIKSRMPRDQPASLTEEAYLQTVAYILQANQFPAGEQALKADSALLSNILITTKGGTDKASASAAITTGTLVQVVGCLEGGADGWRLTSTTAPVRTESPDASPAAQLTALGSAPLGSNTFRLLGIYMPLDGKTGHRMEGKGFLVKDPAGDRLNIVSLETVAATCAP